MATYLTYNALLPKQSSNHLLLAVCARASDVLLFSSIDRIGRHEDGSLKGFQRQQVTNHIREIKNYLSSPNSVLPNSIVVAFSNDSGIRVKDIGNSLAEVKIPLHNQPLGYVVDGQQRLTALASLPEKEFDVFVSILICNGLEELRKQFILINNTKALPKALIYELLPTVQGLPDRLTGRTTAARMVDRLNYDEESSLHGQIKQHTNPRGIIQDTVLQKIIMDSLSGGALRSFASPSVHDMDDDCNIKAIAFEKGFRLISNYFSAVQQVYDDCWINQTPRTSRLVHGVGLVAMTWVMEYLHAVDGAFEKDDFLAALLSLEPYTSWTQGSWKFDGEELKWNSLQYLPKHYRTLGNHLVRTLKSLRKSS